MSHFNLALLPESAELIKTITDLAEKNLSGQTDKYILSKQALPHITVAQFECEPDRLDVLWSSVKELASEPISIQFAHIFVRAGSGQLHQDKNWVGLSLVHNIRLSELQKAVFEKLQECGIESPTRPDTYFPHLTLGRLAKACAITISKMPNKDLWQNAFRFELSLGNSNAIGVYSKRLF